MVNYRVVFTKQAQKDAKKLSALGLKAKAELLIEVLRDNPYQTPPFYEKLVGDLTGAYSRKTEESMPHPWQSEFGAVCDAIFNQRDSRKNDNRGD